MTADRATNVTILNADLSRAEHQHALVTMLEVYMRDPKCARTISSNADSIAKPVSIASSSAQSASQWNSGASRCNGIVAPRIPDARDPSHRHSSS